MAAMGQCLERFNHAELPPAHEAMPPELAVLPHELVDAVPPELVAVPHELVVAAPQEIAAVPQVYHRSLEQPTMPPAHLWVPVQVAVPIFYPSDLTMTFNPMSL